MQIPGTIEFMSQHWQIRAAEPRELNTDLGLCDPIRNTIILDGNLPPDVLLSTLSHELVHLIEITMNLCLTEQQTDCLGAGLVHLFKTNPQLLALYAPRTDHVEEDETE
jgi:hypothetical protein